MNPKPPFAYQNMMALLSLLGFSEICPGRDGFTKFSLFDDHFEAIRYEDEICIGIRLPALTDYEVFALQLAGEDLQAQHPKLHFFFSMYDYSFKIRMWIPCKDADHLGQALRHGIETLTSFKPALHESMLGHIYTLVEADVMESLSTGGEY